MIDSMLLMMSVPSFLMVRGLCVRAAGQRAGQQIADHREPAALVQAERQDGAEGRVVHHAGIGGVGLPAASISRPGSICTFLLLATRTLPIATWLVAKSSTIGSLPLRGTAVQ